MLGSERKKMEALKTVFTEILTLEVLDKINVLFLFLSMYLVDAV